MGPCPKCGEKTSADHAFCLNCGAELPAPDGGSEAGTPQPGGANAPVRSSADSPTSAEESRPAQAGARQPAAAARSRDQGRARRPRQFGGDALIPAMVALLGSLAAQQAITSLVSPDSYLYRLFRPAGGWLMSVVPALILFVFIWTLADLILKLRVARVNETDLRRTEVSQVPAMVRQEPTSTVLQRIRTWDPGLRTRPVGRRIGWVLQHLDSADPVRAHEMTRHQSDLEGDTAASGYRTVRLFIWAMPILGFIGTVLGISLAVGGFSDFLTTDVSIDEIDRVTAELGNVASGLSFAFDTTLLGLLAGLVTSVVSTGVQGKEERFMTGLEEIGLRILESVPSQGGAGRTTSAAMALPGGEEFDEMMRSRLQELSGQMQKFTRAVQTGLDGFLAEWGKLPPEVERVASDLTGLREHLGSASTSMDKMILETRLLLEGLNEASTHLGNRLTSSIGSIGQTVDGLGESLGGVSLTLENSLVGLTERVQASEGHLRAGLTSLQESIDATQRDDEATQTALERLSSTIAGLDGTLAELRETQTAMMPVLNQLSGPLELRLMPSPAAAPRNQ